MVIRHDNARQAGFVMMDGGHTAGKDVGSVGECSYRVFLDVGGQPKTAQQEYANNNFASTFIVFPKSSVATLPLLAKADNADDLPMLIAYGEEAGYGDRSGNSGKPLLDAWVAGGRTGARPRNYKRIVSALRDAGFYAPVGDFPDKKGLDRVARTA